MARTLWGNILESLAGAGISSAAKIGTSMILNPMLQEGEAQKSLVTPLVNIMGTESDPNKLAVANKLLEKITGTSLATGAPATNEGGIEGTVGGRGVTIPTSLPLEELAPEIKTQPGFLKPYVAKDESIRAALINAAAARDVRQTEGELNRQQRADQFQQSMDWKQAQAAQMEAFRRESLESKNMFRNFMVQNATDRLEEMKRRGASQEEQRELSQFIGLQNQIGIATGDQKKALQVQLNKMLENTQNPMLKTFPPYTEEVSIPGTGTTLPLIGEVGTKKQKVPVGTQAPTATTPAPSGPYMLPKNGKMVAVPKDVFDAYQKKWGK